MSKLNPGDVVLFERNGYFSGQINIVKSGSSSAPIVFGAYGTGKDPVISGSVRIKNWSVYSENIFQSKADTVISNLFFNSKQLTIARYPNSGYLTIKEPLKKSHTGFIDNSLKQKVNFWKSSIARIRTINWAYEYAEIKDFRNGTIILEKSTTYPLQKNWGYYLDNNLSVLDTINEWFFKKKDRGGTLYFSPPLGNNPDNLFIEGSIYGYGFYSAKNLKNITIRDLSIQNQSINGIWLIGNNSNIKIVNCTFSRQFQCGINFLNKSEKIEIINCRFYDINGIAIYILNTSNTLVTKNVIENIGMIPGYGTTGDAFSQSAILIIGNKITVSGNNIRNVGHNGINVMGSNNTIEKNVLKNMLLKLNDGGAIKSYGKESNNTVWKNNFIFNVKGNMISADESTNQNFSIGLYLDELSNNMKLLNNTVEGSAFAGIGVNSGYNNLFENNVLFNNSVGIMFYQNHINNKANIVQSNFVFSLKPDQISIENIFYKNNNIPANFSKNFYFNSLNSKTFRILNNKVADYIEFEEWKNYTKADYNSKLIIPESSIYQKLFNNMSDDSVTVLLDSQFKFQDTDKKNVFGTIIIPPWSSKVLFSNVDIGKLPQLEIAGESLLFRNTSNFNILNPQWINLIGKNLQNEIVINSPTGISISEFSDREFSNSMTVKTKNSNTDMIIFVRFDSDLDRKFYDYLTIKSGDYVEKILVESYPN